MPEIAREIAPPAAELSGATAIVGFGETDYALDYATARGKRPGHEPPTAEELLQRAFERALTDAGLERRDIDGLVASSGFGALDSQDAAKLLGLTPRYVGQGEAMFAYLLPRVATAIASGRADTVALVYVTVSRGIGRVFGGNTFLGGGRDSYYYYHPWGWSSQAAHWALMFRYYQSTFGATEADLGSVAITLRNYARLNDNATMTDPLTIEDYLASRYVVKPLRLFDMCLVNDGACCLILRRTDMATDMPHAPVLVSGWADVEVPHSKLDYMVKDRLRTQFQEAARLSLEMAGISLDDIGHFEGYDAASIHLVNQLEGYGFVEPGAGLEFCKEGQMWLGGRLPTNTNGGMLSGAYMTGWNNFIEGVRQLRHEAGARQVDGVMHSLCSVATTESAHPIVLSRGT